MAEPLSPSKQHKSVTFADEPTNEGPNSAPNGDPVPTVDEVTDLFKGLAKKKKSKKSDDKKKAAKAAEADDFDAKLAEAGVGEGEENGAPTSEEAPIEEGDPDKGTGVWSHNATQDIGYSQLLSRFYGLMHSNHPDMMSGGSKSYKIPPPQCLREGNKKTIFANIADICKRMKRSDEHVTSYLFAELGTSGSVDGSKRLVIKGRFQQKQLESVLRNYINEYVTCKTCRLPDTDLNKGENRLYFVTCNSCGSRRSVTAIKTGYSAQIGKRKRQQA